MKANRATFPLAAMCRVLGLSTSGYYGWLKRGGSRRGRCATPTSRTGSSRSGARARETYGVPRIHVALQAEGEAGGPQAGGASDGGAGHRGRDAQALQDGHDEEGSRVPARPGPGGPGLLGRGTRPAVGGRHHMRAHPGPAGCTSRWCSTLGAVGSSAGRWRRTCGPSWSTTRSGWRSAARRPEAGSDPPLRPGKPVHVAGVRAALPRGGGHPVDGLGRRRLRQVSCFMMHPVARVGRWQLPCVSGCGFGGGLMGCRVGRRPCTYSNVGRRSR